MLKRKSRATLASRLKKFHADHVRRVAQIIAPFQIRALTTSYPHGGTLITDDLSEKLRQQAAKQQGKIDTVTSYTGLAAAAMSGLEIGMPYYELEALIDE